MQKRWQGQGLAWAPASWEAQFLALTALHGQHCAPHVGHQGRCTVASSPVDMWSGAQASCWPPTALPGLVPTPGEVGAFSSHKALPSVAKTLSFLTGEFTCTSETWAICGRCFNENALALPPPYPFLPRRPHPSPSQKWQQVQEPPIGPRPLGAGSQKLLLPPPFAGAGTQGQGLAVPPCQSYSLLRCTISTGIFCFNGCWKKMFHPRAKAAHTWCT